MHKLRSHFQFSFLSLCYGTVGILLVVYIGLIAVVMSYASLTVEFSQSVKNDKATVGMLEREYLSSIGRITSTDYVSEGYAKPTNKTFVKTQSVTALR